MATTERQTKQPIGLTRFLVSHCDHGDGFETQKDRSAVTVICRGCDSSFSFLSGTHGFGPREVDAALARLSAPQESSSPRGFARLTPTNGIASTNGVSTNGVPEEPVVQARKDSDDVERASEPPPPVTPPPPPRGKSARRLPPPGPFAPRRRHTPTLDERVRPHVDDATRRIAALFNRRRRPIVLTALALGGAYILVALSLGGQPSSSQTNAPGGSEVPLAPGTSATPAPTDTGAVADDTRTLQTFDAGGPNVDNVTVQAAQFQVAMPPDWQRTAGADGRSVLTPVAGGAEIQVLSRPRGTLGLGQMADEAAAFLALGIPPGTTVERLASTPAGNLMAVARTKGGPDAKTAFIGVSGTSGYLVTRSVSPTASALVRLQADGIVISFAPIPAG